MNSLKEHLGSTHTLYMPLYQPVDSGIALNDRTKGTHGELSTSPLRGNGLYRKGYLYQATMKKRMTTRSPQ
jgi:hypothetical protein